VTPRTTCYDAAGSTAEVPDVKARRHLLLLSSACAIVHALLCLPASATNDGPDPSGKNAPLDLSMHRGKVVYVDFWASWCSPCKQSFPWMEALHDSLSSDGLVIVTINVDHDRKKADAFLERMESKLPVIYDPEGKIAAAYELEAMPSSFVYGRDGALRSRHMGFHADKTDEIEAELRRLLAEEGSDATGH